MFHHQAGVAEGYCNDLCDSQMFGRLGKESSAPHHHPDKDPYRCDSVFDSGIESFKSADLELLHRDEIEESTHLFSQIQLLSPSDILETVAPNSPTLIGSDEAVCIDHDEGFTEASDNSTDQIFQQDEDGDTQLHIAIIHQMTDMVVKMIQSVRSPDLLNIQNDLKQTPLHLAVLTNQPDVVRQLLLAGVCVGQHDSNGNTPLHLACKGGLVECLIQLTKPITHAEATHMQYSVCKLPTLQDMEVLNFEGYSCLHLAGFQGHFAIMQFLLNSGANVNAQDGRSGRTLLHHAVESNNYDLVAYLVQHKSILLDQATWDSGCSALQLAVGRGYSKIATLLISSGADDSNTKLQESEDSFESCDEQEDDQIYDDFTLGGMPL